MNERAPAAVGTTKWDAAQRRSVLEELAASHLDAEGLDPSFQRVDLPTDATAMGLTPIKPSQSSDHRPIDRVSGDQHARVFALIGAARNGTECGEEFAARAGMMG